MICPFAQADSKQSDNIVVVKVKLLTIMFELVRFCCLSLVRYLTALLEHLK